MLNGVNVFLRKNALVISVNFMIGAIIGFTSYMWGFYEGYNQGSIDKRFFEEYNESKNK